MIQIYKNNGEWIITLPEDSLHKVWYTDDRLHNINDCIGMEISNCRIRYCRRYTSIHVHMFRCPVKNNWPVYFSGCSPERSQCAKRTQTPELIAMISSWKWTRKLLCSPPPPPAPVENENAFPCHLQRDRFFQGWRGIATFAPPPPGHKS